MDLLEGIRSQRAADWRWQEKGESGELADEVNGFCILLQEVESFSY